MGRTPAGRCIDSWGGRPVLMGTNLIFAAGLSLLGMAQSLTELLLAWALLGVGMGSGLYEAAFAGLVRLYGREGLAKEHGAVAHSCLR